MGLELNAVTGKLDKVQSLSSLDARYLKLDQTTAQTVTGGTPSFDDIRLVLAGTITRDSDNFITSLAKTGGRTLTPTRNASNYITSLTDGTKTWTLTRNADNFITSWSVA